MAYGRGIMVTGTSGYLGSLIAATLLSHATVRILTPTRGRAESVLEAVAAELASQGISLDQSHRERLQVTAMPPIEELDQLSPVMREFGVEEVIHCAACLDYFNKAALETVNVELTRRIVELSLDVGVERFIYMSTAFSSGYVESPVPEQLHEEPERDPTDYTRTKRAAERVVAASGLPYLIIRPSIVIGDSRDGHYN